MVDAFNLDIIEVYGSVEMGIMAFQISDKSGLQLCNDLTWFELLDKNGNPVLPGKPGRIVVTDLIGKTMPFIRYDQGDSVITGVSEDKDGEIKTKILKIIGRDEEKIILRNGTMQSFHNFDQTIKKYEGIFQFRVIQKAVDYFLLYIFTDNDYFDSIKDPILKELEEKFPKYCKFDIFRTGPMKPDPNGKLRRFVSEVKSSNIKSNR